MVDFAEHVLKPAAEADAYIAEKGGLPEIISAAQSLQEAIDRTRIEIATEPLSSRFSTEPDHNLDEDLRNAHFSPMVRGAAAEGGFAGFKKAELTSELDGIQHGFVLLISQLVRLRAHHYVSKTEFPEDLEPDAEQ